MLNHLITEGSWVANNPHAQNTIETLSAAMLVQQFVKQLLLRRISFWLCFFYFFILWRSSRAIKSCGSMRREVDSAHMVGFRCTLGLPAIWSCSTRRVEPRRKKMRFTETDGVIWKYDLTAMTQRRIRDGQDECTRNIRRIWNPLPQEE